MSNHNNRIVFFPHDGMEHALDKCNNVEYSNLISSTLYHWNVLEKHRRKFLSVKGEYLTTDKCNEKPTKSDDIRFWGEYEANSSIRKLENQEVKFIEPVYLHRPLFSDTGRTKKDLINFYLNYKSRISSLFTAGDLDKLHVILNTDPYVFGEEFLYSNCKQTKSDLKFQRGDVIIFHSVAKKKAYIDTVLVVSTSQQYNLDDIKEIIEDEIEPVPEIMKKYNVSELFVRNTLLPLAFENWENNGVSFTLYRGATKDNPVDEMFSYFPCIAEDESSKNFGNYKRCQYFLETKDINVHGINKNVPQTVPLTDAEGYRLYGKSFATQGRPGSAKERILKEGDISSKEFWESLTKRILDSNYYLGIKAEEPREGE